MATYNGKRYFIIGKGDTGRVYRAVRDDNPDNTVIKHPVSRKEFELAEMWAERNINEEDNYSAGPVKMVDFVLDSGEEVTGMQMTFLGTDTYEDISHKLSPGETVLLYLMIIHCTLRAEGILIRDTAWHNCMCQGREENFMIGLVDTYEWRTRELETTISSNFNRMCWEFSIKYLKHLSKIHYMVDKRFDTNQEFLHAMIESCKELADDFLYSDKHSESVHYHERIDDLLAKIEKDASKARMRLQAFDALHSA